MPESSKNVRPESASAHRPPFCHVTIRALALASVLLSAGIVSLASQARAQSTSQRLAKLSTPPGVVLPPVSPPKPAASPQNANAQSPQGQTARSKDGSAATPSNPLGSRASAAKSIEDRISSKLKDLRNRAPAVGNFTVYGLDRSRKLFAACDLNGDDRISFFEAKKSFFNGTEREGFQSFDKNKDGVIQFAEFDAGFKELAKFGSPLQLRSKALARLENSGALPIALAPSVLRFFSSVDADGDDRISSEEWNALGPMLELLVGKGSEDRFLALDSDLSGSLSPSELRSLQPKLEVFSKRAEAVARKKQLRPLPIELQAADLNADSRLDSIELARALSRIHPSLVRHGKAILARCDQNRDRQLDAIELREAQIVR